MGWTVTSAFTILSDLDRAQGSRERVTPSVGLLRWRCTGRAGALPRGGLTLAKIEAPFPTTFIRHAQMVVRGALSLIVAAGIASFQTVSLGAQQPGDSSSLVSISRIARYPVDSSADGRGPDTVQQRRRSVEVGEWYARRLTIHRYAAYSTIPVFAFQYVAGERLFKEQRDAPQWAKTGHRVGATALAGIFTINTVTGAWNWWDSRSAPKGRVLRTIHAISLLSADAAFTYAGLKLSEEAENSDTKRRLHRTVALSAIGVTTVSGIAMKILNR